MNRGSTSLLLFLASSAAVVLAACGGAESAPAKTGTPGKPPAEDAEPHSVTEAQEQIERARAELSGDAKKSEADKDSVTMPGAGGSTGSTKPSEPPSAREESSRKASLDACNQLCRALSSMRRAVSALCRMTGDEDTRCSDAKRTLQQSESRVAQCHCSP